jgi:chaperonin GroEL
MDVRPLHDRIIVRRLEEGEQKSGAIIIPDTAREKPQRGEVIAAGSGKVNLLQAGVIDPTKVVRSALQHAASIASLLLTTGAVISQIPEKHQPAATSPGGMDGMY